MDNSISSNLVGHATYLKLLNTLPDRLLSAIQPTDEGDLQMLLDLPNVTGRFQLWQDLMPNVKPFYAVKALPDGAIIRHLALLGAHFDCATKQEIQLCLHCGVDPQRILFANPLKHPAHMTFAHQHNVQLSVFDSEFELQKHAQYWPNTKLLLRVDGKVFHSRHSLSGKFGVPITTAARFLELAEKWNLQVVGFSFHVGCQCLDREAYKYYTSLCIQTILQLREKFQHFHNLHVVDIGGGFHGSWSDQEMSQFAEHAKAVQESLSDNATAGFINVWAEPGRFFAESASHVAFRVLLKTHLDHIPREEKSALTKVCYTLNASFAPPGAMLILLHSVSLDYPPTYIVRNRSILEFQCLPGERRAALFRGKFHHPEDVFMKVERCPELELGDWLIWSCFGSYTYACAAKYEARDWKKTVLADEGSIRLHLKEMFENILKFKL